jgi:hypothetical protein
MRWHLKRALTAFNPPRLLHGGPMIGGNSAKAPPNRAGDLAKSKNLQELQEAPKLYIDAQRNPKVLKGHGLAIRFTKSKLESHPPPKTRLI